MCLPDAYGLCALNESQGNFTATLDGLSSPFSAAANFWEGAEPNAVIYSSESSLRAGQHQLVLSLATPGVPFDVDYVVITSDE
jgi:hypothetical protein